MTSGADAARPARYLPVGSTPVPRPTSRPAGTRVAVPAGVAAGHPDTARSGVDILRRGGSAADAVGAMIVTGCVAETLFTGLGGGGFATVYEAATGAVSCLDFFVTVPGLDGTRAAPATTIDVSFGGVPVPYAMGGPTVAVPGNPAGVAELHRRFGTVDWVDIIAPARDLARTGSRFSRPHADLLPEVAAAMVAGAGRGSYLPNGETLLAAGELLRHDGLADTLEQFRQHGPDMFYTGRWAEDFVAAVQADGGALSEADLAAYRVADLPVATAGFGPAIVHVRDNDLDGFAATLARIDTAALRAGPVARARALITGLRAPARRSETTSVAAVDAAGNACAATHTLGLGSGVWVGGVHGNSMLGEGELLRGDLHPGDRMPSMMVPLIVLDGDGRLMLAGGAAGGSRIRPALVQVLGNILVQNMPAVEAVRAPRLNVAGDTVHLEPGFPADMVTALSAGGIPLVHWDRQRPYFGGVSVVAPDGPAADPRRGGSALSLTPSSS